MKYITFRVFDDISYQCMRKTLTNIGPELNNNFNLLIDVEDEDLFLRVRNEWSDLLESCSYGEVRVIYKEKIEDYLKDALARIIVVYPYHILGRGAIKRLNLDDELLNYGFIAIQSHDECFKSNDLYDELNTELIKLSDCKQIRDGVYIVDTTYNATYMLSVQNFKQFFFNDNNLGLYLRRLGYTNFIDSNIVVKEAITDG